MRPLLIRLIREALMDYRLPAVMLLLMNAVFALPALSKSIPFTQNQVQGMVRHGMADATSAKPSDSRALIFLLPKSSSKASKPPAPRMPLLLP